MNRWYEYSKHEPMEVRVWKGAFWVGILLFILWVEVVIGIAVYRYLLP